MTYDAILARARRAAYLALRENEVAYAATLDMPCLTCGVTAGMLCRTPNGGYAKSAHSRRIADYGRIAIGAAS